MIKMVVMDVDGTLTDGKIYMGNNGEVMKAFSCHDAVGVRKLSDYGIIPVIITGRESQIVLNRAIEMNMKNEFIFQNISNKIVKLEEIMEKLDISYDEIAYIGDDENDLECIERCGFCCCPNNAMDFIKEKCDFISKYDSGNGAVREIVDYIILNMVD